MPGGGCWGQYAPYVDPIQERNAAERAYFDNNGSLQRLKELKVKWDPSDLFWCEIGVGPALGNPREGKPKELKLQLA